MPASPAPSALLPWTLRPRLAYALYQGLAHLLLLPLLGWAAWKARREPLYTAHLPQRFGACPEAAAGCLWVFAASLGETRAVTPLLRTLLARGHRLLLTHSTPAGLAEGQRQFAAEIAAGLVVQGYAPLDLFWAVRRLLRRARPAALLVVEAEVWPAQIAESVRAGVPVVKVNANLTERSLERDLASPLRRIILFFYKGFSLVLTKTPDHVARYERAGVDPARLLRVGELKFDLPPRRDLIARAADLRPQLAGRRGVWAVASSTEAEEEALFGVLRALHDRLADPPLVVWAPRSPQRFDAVAARLAREGWRSARRSVLFDDGFRGDAPAGLDVLLADSLGEMDFTYALADVVFVGATLTDMGGHNATEPLMVERPVVTGPSTWAIPAPAAEAVARGAMREFADGAALADGLVELFRDRHALAAFAARARGLTERHTGAAHRSAAAIELLLAGRHG
ncbi:3-deoxy-D-manno-octulosonic acid transferase [Oceaniglobus roseus]|uniref:3-deoxy-D-manno-octulosonic acid transferase n=1 Tax=Oceaniglobus roseus TaxID=1737570 RepID=UPI000C7F6BBB|nr:glycosyltransferase N-terminal domain-containing protein [Kandeliimicrobium roseum]